MFWQVIDLNGAAGEDRTHDLPLTKKAVLPESGRNPSLLLRLTALKTGFFRPYVSHTCPIPHAERLCYAGALTFDGRRRRWWGVA